MHDDRRIVIFDLDGTLADISHRLHFIKGDIKDWDGFHGAMDEDELKEDIARLFWCLKHMSNLKLVIVTGRQEKYRKQTYTWLHKNNLDTEELYMRPDGNYEKDYKIKEEILNRIAKQNVTLVIEDRKQVADMWRRNGITCLQCHEGDY